MSIAKCFAIFLLVFGIIGFLDTLFVFIFYIYYSTKAIRILFYIIFCLQCLIHIFYLFIELPLRNNSINNLRIKFSGKKTSVVVSLILFFLFIFEIILISFILGYNYDYWINCPFTLTDNLNEHYERRCELYKINTNSRYKYQFICSYDPTDDFKYESKDSVYQKRRTKRKVLKALTKKIKKNYLACVKVNNVIENNDIISLFTKEYENICKYYCSRTNVPEKYSHVNDKDCNNKTKNVFIIVLYCISYVKIFFFLVIWYI